MKSECFNDYSEQEFVNGSRDHWQPGTERSVVTGMVRSDRIVHVMILLLTAMPFASVLLRSEQPDHAWIENNRD